MDFIVTGKLITEKKKHSILQMQKLSSHAWHYNEIYSIPCCPYLWTAGNCTAMLQDRDILVKYSRADVFAAPWDLWRALFSPTSLSQTLNNEEQKRYETTCLCVSFEIFSYITLLSVLKSSRYSSSSECIHSKNTQQNRVPADTAFSSRSSQRNAKPVHGGSGGMAGCLGGCVCEGVCRQNFCQSS